ncbi:MAG: helix-turn-helix transcriptional regulator [Clostridia bacterium]|nr:helix-turn-helix transcriptional regulator [Clostridia bacterium]
MDQIKIGKFISECRKNKKLTQSQLAEKLDITDRAISKWETGKSMPDPSLMLKLCKELDITVNELLSGEKLNDENYQERADENMINIAKESEKNKKIRNRFIIAFSCIILIGLIYFTGYIIYWNMDLQVEYDGRVMSCEILDDVIRYEIKGISVIDTYHIEVETESETIMFITNKIALKNKVRSHWESWECMAEMIYNKIRIFGSIDTWNKNEIIQNGKEKIKVYYTEVSFSKIEKADKEELKNIIEESELIAENN